MIPRHLHANGVPWLVWFGVHAWECRGCGETGSQPLFTDVSSFAKWAGDMKRAHARCGRPIHLGVGEVGHPLNPDRKER
jgi:secreted trypsin-like serine protease